MGIARGICERIPYMKNKYTKWLAEQMPLLVKEELLSDVQGRRVATLADGNLPAGRTPLVWARATRAEAAAGIYFARLEAAGRSWTRRVAAIP